MRATHPGNRAARATKPKQIPRPQSDPKHPWRSRCPLYRNSLLRKTQVVLFRCGSGGTVLWIPHRRPCRHPRPGGNSRSGFPPHRVAGWRCVQPSFPSTNNLTRNGRWSPMLKSPRLQIPDAMDECFHSKSSRVLRMNGPDAPDHSRRPVLQHGLSDWDFARRIPLSDVAVANTERFLPI